MLKIGLIICSLAYTLCYYINDVELRQHIYFIGHAIGLLLISFSWKGNKKWKDILTGFSIGRIYDEIYFFVLNNEETELSYSLLLLFAFPILGHLWRNYRSTVSRTLAISGVSLALKYIATGIVWLFDKIFN